MKNLKVYFLKYIYGLYCYSSIYRLFMLYFLALMILSHLQSLLVFHYNGMKECLMIGQLWKQYTIQLLLR